MAATVFAQEPILNRSPATLTRPETFRVRIENQKNGVIAVSHDRGKTWKPVGAVVQPNNSQINFIEDHEFTASDWAPVGGIAASAVNAIHVKVGVTDTHAKLFSILPFELTDRRLVSGSYYSNSTSIITSLKAGKKLFGAHLGFHVGDPLFWEIRPGELVPWPIDKAPNIGDVLVVMAQESPTQNWTLEFENHPGGYVTYQEGDGPRYVVAIVEKAVSGSGRFLGGLFQEHGHIRANHPGVIDIKTSPAGGVGGFQIVPNFHASSSGLSYVYNTPAYMVLQSTNGSPLEGTFPLFQNLIRPGDIVEAKVNGTWQKMPYSSGLNPTGLQHLDGFRITPSKRYLNLSD